MSGGGWLEKLGIRLSQLPTKMKLKLKLSLAILGFKTESKINITPIQGDNPKSVGLSLFNGSLSYLPKIYPHHNVPTIT